MSIVADGYEFVQSGEDEDVPHDDVVVWPGGVAASEVGHQASHHQQTGDHRLGDPDVPSLGNRTMDWITTSHLPDKYFIFLAVYVCW